MNESGSKSISASEIKALTGVSRVKIGEDEMFSSESDTEMKKKSGAIGESSGMEPHVPSSSGDLHGRP